MAPCTRWRPRATRASRRLATTSTAAGRGSRPPTTARTKHFDGVRTEGAAKRAQRYEAYLTPAQVETFELWRAGARWWWNQLTERALERTTHWRVWRVLALRQGATATEAAKWAGSLAGHESRYTLAREVHELREAGAMYPYRGQEVPIAAVPAVLLHGALAEHCDAWARHLRARGRSSPPGYRSAHRGGSVRWQVQDGSGPAAAAKVVRSDGGRYAVVRTLGDLGPVKVRYHRALPPDALVGYLVLGVDATGRYWLVVQYETAQVRQGAATGMVGVDRGVAVTLATSDGDAYDAPVLPPGQERRRLRLARALARKRRLSPCAHDAWVTGPRGRPKLVRGHCDGSDCRCWKHSRRYQADKLALLRLIEHAARQRHDGAHKASRALADRYALVVMEDLDVSAMSASARGTDEAPGRNVRAKTGLNRSILAGNWYEVERLTAYKTGLAKVPAHHTSQTCPACGLISTENRPTRDRFLCAGCGQSGHADVVAAHNIAARWATTSAAQTEEGQETCAPAGAQPAKAHAIERSGAGTGTVERSHPAQYERIGTEELARLVPTAWGLGSARRAPSRPSSRRMPHRSPRNGRKVA